MREFVKNAIVEPFRLFFPLAIISLLISVSVWVPQIWSSDWYPVLIHRTFVLNGFIGFFIAGFLMTAVPKFSKTNHAKPMEICLYLIATFSCFGASIVENSLFQNISTSLQAIVLLFFLLTRISKRKENVPFSFVFIFVGLLLWLISGVIIGVSSNNLFINLHYEGAITAIILGVGTRLIPGILGHVEIVGQQRQKYETATNLLSTIPISFIMVIVLFIISYLLSETYGSFSRTFIITYIAIRYWKILKLPKIKSALTTCIWINCWSIILSFVLKTVWPEGIIHASHAYFISGILLICLLIGTRVLQAHGPGRIELENSKYLYFITFLIILAASTRVIAYAVESLYYSHLGYSSTLIIIAVLIWSYRYLRFVSVKNKNH